MELKGLSLVKRAVAALHDKKAENIVVLDLKRLSAVADYFIICTGNSGVHLKALGDHLAESLKNGKTRNARPFGVEGYGSESWVLYDYIDVVVHLFTGETRDFYSLERLWNDARRIAPEGLLKPGSGSRSSAAKSGRSISG